MKLTEKFKKAATYPLFRFRCWWHHHVVNRRYHIKYDFGNGTAAFKQAHIWVDQLELHSIDAIIGTEKTKLTWTPYGWASTFNNRMEVSVWFLNETDLNAAIIML